MAYRVPMYEIEVRHPGLGTYRHIRGRERRVVEQKAQAQLARWDDQWARKVAAEDAQRARDAVLAAKEQKKARAEKRTFDAACTLEEADNILSATLTVDDKIDWESLKDKTPFDEIKPLEPTVSSPPPPPHADHFQPKIGFLGFIIPAIRRERIKKSEEDFSNARLAWEKEVERHKSMANRIRSDFEKAFSEWQHRKEVYEAEQADRNRAVDDLAYRYAQGEPDAVEEHADLVLSRSQYPDWINRDWEIEYQSDSRILIINYDLPTPENFPKLKSVNYVASRDTFDEKFLTPSEIRRRYDALIYQICLRTIHELFEADRDHTNIEAINFNGIVNFTDRSTGRPATNCICSIQVGRQEFSEINLSEVDPKACFKALKGVAASQLEQMAPVAPLMRLNREDARFTPGADALSRVEEGENLAAMNWQDFEHLIRQLFEREFSGDGCEVKVTRGSRDGGVDAVAFDPDPIRGGKIVIQAKRYTNTVGVEAVRDLYGTVVNEGATKGILVTTSNYGPDARKFAASKPLALIDGANLLYMLRATGRKARIDLAEAKLLLAK